jgi:hypothetical protein
MSPGKFRITVRMTGLNIMTTLDHFIELNRTTVSDFVITTPREVPASCLSKTSQIYQRNS